MLASVPTLESCKRISPPRLHPKLFDELGVPRDNFRGVPYIVAHLMDQGYYGLPAGVYLSGSLANGYFRTVEDVARLKALLLEKGIDPVEHQRRLSLLLPDDIRFLAQFSGLEGDRGKLLSPSDVDIVICGASSQQTERIRRDLQLRQALLSIISELLQMPVDLFLNVGVPGGQFLDIGSNRWFTSTNGYGTHWGRLAVYNN